MIFSSITFLYFFLPIVCIAYFLVPAKGRNFCLLIASLLFYGWGEPVYLFLMLAAILESYLFGILIEKYRRKKWSKWILTTSVLCSLSMLVFFKYTDFLIDTVNRVIHGNLPLLHIALPIGISFYTFQSISYLVDVWRGEVSAQKNIIALATYIAMFPQLIAGPIVRYQDVEAFLYQRNTTFQDLDAGISRFLTGLSKKVILANQLGILVEQCKSSAEPSVLMAWLYAVGFLFQIYFDFSGYSDMAIGLGRIFGFHFPENFRYPYCSASVTEFWRNWHMTLGRFFRDYLYIPLGGNRVSLLKWVRNIMIVWMATGIWHGASFQFLWWGIYFGILLIIEKKWLLSFLNKHRLFARIYTLFAVMISFIIFNGTGYTDIITQIMQLFAFGTIPFADRSSVYVLSSNLILLAVSATAVTPVWKKIGSMVAESRLKGIFWGMKYVWLVLMLLLVTGFLVDGSYNPFLYFRF